MLSKDQALKIFLDGTVHLSKKDYSFFYNLSNIIRDNKEITTNQSKLFDKLVLKYQRQLRKNGYDIQAILGLAWEIKIIETAQEYLDAQIRLIDGKIEIKTPFKSEFVNVFRKYVIYDIHDNSRQYINPYEWDKSKKLYRAPYSTISLKIALSHTKKYFQTTVMCDAIKHIVELVDDYKEIKIWNPTLVCSNGCYYVGAINEVLATLLDQQEFSNDPKFLFELSKLGIDVDSSVVKDDYILRLASEYINTQSLDDMDQILPSLKKIGISNIVFSRDLIYQKSIYNTIKTKAELLGFLILSESNTKETGDFVYMTLKSSPVSGVPAAKILILKNNNPIKVS